jgi:hypothetical protein
LLGDLNLEKAYEHFKDNLFVLRGGISKDTKHSLFNKLHTANLIVSDKIIIEEAFKGQRGHSLMTKSERKKYMKIMSIGFAMSVNISVLFHHSDSDDVKYITEVNKRLLCESHNRVVEFMLRREENNQVERNQEQLSLKKKNITTGPVFSFLVALDILHNNPKCKLALETYGNKRRFAYSINPSDFNTDKGLLSEEISYKLLSFILDNNIMTEIGFLMCFFDYVYSKNEFNLLKAERNIGIGVTVYCNSHNNEYCPVIDIFKTPYIIKEPFDAVKSIERENGQAPKHTFIAVSGEFSKVFCFKPIGGFLPDILQTNRSKEMLKKQCPVMNLKQAQTYMPFLRQTNTDACQKLQNWKQNCFVHYTAKELSSSHLQLSKLEKYLNETVKEWIENYETLFNEKKSDRGEFSVEIPLGGNWEEVLAAKIMDTVHMVKQRLRFFNILPCLKIGHQSFMAVAKRLEFILKHLNQHLNLPNSVLSLTLIEDAIKRMSNFYNGKFLKGDNFKFILIISSET